MDNIDYFLYEHTRSMEEEAKEILLAINLWQFVADTPNILFKSKWN